MRLERRWVAPLSVALMLLPDSRRAARLDDVGDLILLELQDRSLWNRAQIAERHGNFIVYLGGAMADDVRQLMELARREVHRQFGVELVAEVKLLGEWEKT